MSMTVVTLDFETYWDSDYTLTKMSPLEYIHDPRFEAISVAIKIGSNDTEVVWGPAIAEKLQSIDWSKHAAVAHNGNEFDFPILVWKFDCHPALFIDTAALARAKHQSVEGVSLKALSEIYRLARKDVETLTATKGKRYLDLLLEEMVRLGQYNKVDTDNCHELLRIFSRHTSKEEFMLADMTARMICYPKFELDAELLQTTLVEADRAKQQVLEGLCDVFGVVDTDQVRAMLMSNPKFAAALEHFGVDPPRKISKTTNKETYAFAKTDDAFVELLEHEDINVQTLASARISTKSTLLETRIKTMLACGTALNGKMAVPLAYHAATTGRWGGRIWNPQNLPRIPRDKEGNIIPKPTNALRMSLRAPKGHMVVVSDLSGIELRVNHFLWDVRSTQELYEQDPQADLYKEFAASMYAKDKGLVTKEERQLAKVAQLGLGFGAGAATFQRVAKTMGGIDLDLEEAVRVVQAWRAKYDAIVRGWKKCQTLVSAMHSGARFSPDPRQLVVTEEPMQVTLPSGRRLYYPLLRQATDDEGKQQFFYGYGKRASKVYSGLMDENLVQAIARDVIAYHALQIKKQTGYTPVHMVHDELVYVAPEAEAAPLLDEVNTIMRKPPPWLQGIVLFSEGDVAETYGHAK